jgi:hypothetical protein
VTQGQGAVMAVADGIACRCSFGLGGFGGTRLWRLGAGALLMLVGAAACGGSSGSPAAASRSVVVNVTTGAISSAAPTGSSGGQPAAVQTSGLARAPGSCRSETPVTLGDLGPVATIAGKGYSINALIMAPDFPAHAGNVKIVWRVTGSGPLVLSADGPAGRHAPLLFGPEPHGGSNFTGAGDEWGSGFSFSVPGCWTVHVSRGTLDVNVVFGVLPS